MAEKYRGKYRIPSTRWQQWDYGWNGAYFITIVTKNREHFFGKIRNAKMILSETGQIARKYWYEIPNHFPFVRLDAFVVMPNHIHGILIIDKNQTGNKQSDTTAKNNKRWKPGTIGVIINQYKRICKIKLKEINPFFDWQSRFHDRVIRDVFEFSRIQNYIIDNPKKWIDDDLY